MESRTKGNGEYSLTADAIRGRVAMPCNARGVDSIPSPSVLDKKELNRTRYAGISSLMNIPTPCALKASFQIFGRGMRTQAPSRFALGAGFDEHTSHHPRKKK